MNGGPLCPKPQTIRLLEYSAVIFILQNVLSISLAIVLECYYLKINLDNIYFRPDVDLNSPSLMPNCDILVIDSETLDSDTVSGADREGLITHPSPPPCNIISDKSGGGNHHPKSGGLKVKVRVKKSDVNSNALTDIEDLIDERLI